MLGVGGGVGEDGDLGRAGLGVDADDALEQALGRGDVDVARAGDQAHRLAVDGSAPSSSRSRRRTPPPPGRRRRRRPRRRPSRAQAARTVGCGQPPWSRCGGLATARIGTPASLGGHDVHDDAAGVDGKAAGHVEADPVDRHPALGDGAAVGDVGRRVGAALVLVDEPGPPDRLLERRRAPRGRGPPARRASTSAGTRRARRADAVEPLGGGVQRRGAPVADVLARWAGRRRARPRRRTRPGAGRPRSSRRPRRAAPQVDARDDGGGGAAGGAGSHDPSLGFVRWRSGPRPPGRRGCRHPPATGRPTRT